jgi:hypothetical protein
MGVKETVGKAVATAQIVHAVATGGSQVGSDKQMNDYASAQARDQQAAVTRNAETATRANNTRQEQQG